MAYDINLYATKKVQDHCQQQSGDQYEMLKKQKTYFDGAFNRTNYSANVTWESKKIYAPQEDYRGRSKPLTPVTSKITHLTTLPIGSEST